MATLRKQTGWLTGFCLGDSDLILIEGILLSGSARQVLRRWQRNRLRSLVLLQYDAIDAPRTAASETDVEEGKAE